MPAEAVAQREDRTNLHYPGEPNIKNDGVVEEWDAEKLAEYQRCMNDVDYFVNTYVKIISLDEGLIPFKPYPYQSTMWKNFNDHRFNIVLACRQSGKSVGVVGYLLWYALFHTEKNIAILANKGSTSKKILGRIRLALENIPFFLQPGCKTYNKTEVIFSNNSVLFSDSTSSSSIRGDSVNLLYLDEFAFVENDNEFYTSTYPVITAGKTTKVIITSTANGVGNTFHKLWTGALQRVNGYHAFRVDWWDVPGRDEAWKLETINNTSLKQFEQEYGNTFFGTGDTLIDANVLMELKMTEPKHISENGNLFVYEGVQPEHNYIMTVDVSKGIGQDYSTFNLIDLTVRPFKQVAVYRNNNISPILFPSIIYKYANLYNEAYVVIENNDQGNLVCQGLWQDHEYENMHMESTVKAELGVNMNRKVKRLGCTGFKDILEGGKLTVVDAETISEISTFESKGQSYEASSGNNDDLVMNLVMFGYMLITNEFLYRTDINIKELLYSRRIQEIEDDVPLFGIVDDGDIDEHSIEELKDPWSILDYEVQDEGLLLVREF